VNVNINANVIMVMIVIALLNEEILVKKKKILLIHDISQRIAKCVIFIEQSDGEATGVSERVLGITQNEKKKIEMKEMKKKIHNHHQE